MKPGDLDDKYVPLAAAGVAALADKLAVRLARVTGFFRGLGGASLRTLDDRYAASGPLALMRDVPQVGFVLIAAVFLAGAGTAVTRENARDRAARQQAGPGPSPGTSQAPPADSALGPEVGETTVGYEANAARSLTEAAAGSPHSTRMALVSLDRYLTPTQVSALVQGAEVRRVFLRAKAAGKEAAQIPVDIKADLLGELRTAYTATARGRLEAQKSYQGYVDSLVVTTQDEQAFKDLYAAFARSTGIEAREYQRGCACLYALVVEAPAAQLQALRSRPGVRAVEVAGAGLELRELQVLPLLPEISGVVPKAQAGSGTQP